MTLPATQPQLTAADPIFGGDLAFLAAYSQFFAVSRDLDATLETALAGILAATRAEAGALLLQEPGDGGLTCRIAAGPHPLRGARIEHAGDLVARCLRHNAVEFADAPEPGLCASMATDGRPFGVIELRGKSDGGAFDGRDAHLLQTLANLAALAVANARMADELVQRQVTQRELDLAAEIQRNLLPRRPDGDYPVSGINRPIRQVSGDFYDFFPLTDDKVAFALGDVSGKGINAALLMAKAASLFRCLGKRSDDPAAILSILNREIHETASRGMFVTMVAGTYEPERGRLLFANAGHEPPLLRAPDHSYATFPAEAPPLGIVPEMPFWNQEAYLDGGEFYIFSDGLMEFRYEDSEELGVDGLIQLLEGLVELPLDRRLEALIAALDREGWEVRDDLTVLGIDGSWERQAMQRRAGGPGDA